MRSTCKEPPWRAREDHSIRASPCTDKLQGSPFYIHVNWIEMLMQASSTTKLGSNIFRPSFLTTFWLHNIWKYNLYYKSKSLACHRTPWDLCRQARWAPDIRLFAFKWYVWKRGLVNGTYLEKRPYGYKCYLYMERPCGGYKRYKWEEDLINVGRRNGCYKWNISGKETLWRLIGCLSCSHGKFPFGGNDVSSHQTPDKIAPEMRQKLK